MNSLPKLLAVAAAFVFVAIVGSSESVAEEGQPIAIRHWPGGGFTVESMWDLHVGVGLSKESKTLLPRSVDAELETLPGLKGVFCTLYRDANKSKVTLVEEFKNVHPDEMHLCISKAYETKEHRNARPLSNTTVVTVDGVQIQFMDHDRMTMERRLELMKISGPASKKEQEGKGVRNDYVVVATGDQFTAKFCKDYAENFSPGLMIVNASIKKVGESEVEAFEHNTIAISKLDVESKTTRFVSLGTEPYRLSKEVADLFARKEASQKSSREMFAKLSVEQMNFKPANGSHTPRWNAEHMMGRELGFFSEILNAVDPSIPVMNLNPKQMPEDYEFAHADWDGAEEARQMKRVEDFTRRFAYLLDGMDLDKKAKGSRFWTPRKLLMQMERHYNEHSANVVKKMKLEGWPQD